MTDEDWAELWDCVAFLVTLPTIILFFIFLELI